MLKLKAALRFGSWGSVLVILALSVACDGGPSETTPANSPTVEVREADLDVECSPGQHIEDGLDALAVSDGDRCVAVGASILGQDDFRCYAEISDGEVNLILSQKGRRGFAAWRSRSNVTAAAILIAGEVVTTPQLVSETLDAVTLQSLAPFQLDVVMQHFAACPP